MTASIKDKKIKKQGPFRTGLILFLLIFSALCVAYTYLFMDIHLRLLGSWSLTKIHGAEVNIGKITTSFRKASLKLENLQITSKDKPTENILQIEEISFVLLWDALLRAKFVMPNAKFSQIQIHTQRKTPGSILKIDKDETSLKEDIKNNKAINEVKDEALALGKKKFKNNALGDIANILGGTDTTDQLKKIKTTLASVKLIEEMEQDLKQKEESWRKQIKTLSSKEEYDALVKRAEEFKFNKKKPLRSVKEISKISKEAKVKFKSAKALTKDIKESIDKYSSSIKNIDTIIQKDIDSLTKRLNIPELDMKDMSKDIFMSILDKKMGSYKKYFNMIEEYLPKAKTQEEKEAELASKITAQKRQKSKIYQFSKANSYPLLWLKLATVSSKSSISNTSADLKGIIKDITSSPKSIGKPATIDLTGDFPHQDIKGLKAYIKIDRTSAKSLDSLEMSIKSFPIKNQSLSNSSALEFKIKEANGSTDLKFVSSSDLTQVKIHNRLYRTKYEIKAQKPKVTRILSDVTHNIKSINLNANATGPSLTHLDWKITSNFGKKLAAGIKVLLKNKMNKAKQKVREHILAQVSGKQNNLKGKYQKIKTSTQGLLDKKLGANKNASEQVKSTVDKRKKKFSNKSSRKVKKIQKKLKNKFKSKFKKFKF